MKRNKFFVYKWKGFWWIERPNQEAVLGAFYTTHAKAFASARELAAAYYCEEYAFLLAKVGALDLPPAHPCRGMVVTRPNSFIDIFRKKETT